MNQALWIREVGNFLSWCYQRCRGLCGEGRGGVDHKWCVPTQQRAFSCKGSANVTELAFVLVLVSKAETIALLFCERSWLTSSLAHNILGSRTKIGTQENLHGNTCVSITNGNMSSWQQPIKRATQVCRIVSKTKFLEIFSHRWKPKDRGLTFLLDKCVRRLGRKRLRQDCGPISEENAESDAVQMRTHAQGCRQNGYQDCCCWTQRCFQRNAYQRLTNNDDHEEIEINREKNNDDDNNETEMGMGTKRWYMKLTELEMKEIRAKIWRHHETNPNIEKRDEMEKQVCSIVKQLNASSDAMKLVLEKLNKLDERLDKLEET